MSAKKTGKRPVKLLFDLYGQAQPSKTIKHTKKTQELHKSNITHIKDMHQDVRNRIQAESPELAINMH